MNSNWNTRRFSRTLSKSFFRILNGISSNEQILVIQPEVLPVINALFTFTQLTESTPARKIVLMGEQLQDEVTEILSTFPGMDLIFVIDVRLDLTLPVPLIQIARTLDLSVLNIVFCTWETQEGNNLIKNDRSVGDARIPHFIESQLETSSRIKLVGWNMLPFPDLDDDVLIAHVLYNSDDENMYSPRENFMQTATRSVLMDNMVNCLETLLNYTQADITHAVSFGEESKRLLQSLRQRVQTEENREELFIKETLYGEKYSGLETDLIIMERDMDPLTPLLTQLTYAGLVDDLYGFIPGAKTKNKKEISLKYADDYIWADLKFLNFGDVGPKLNIMAKNSDDQYSSRPRTDNLGELKQFVDAIPELQEHRKLISKHIDLSGDILKLVENEQESQFNRILELEQNMLSSVLDNRGGVESILELIYENQLPVNTILRLACVLSLCKNGLRDKDYQLIKQELVDAFGINMIFQLEWLNNRGLLTSKSLLSNINHTTWRKEYRNTSVWLDTLPRTEEANKDEPAFAYCGVIPLTARLIQLAYDRSVVSKNYNSQQPFIISRSPNILKIGELMAQIYGDPNLVSTESWMLPLRKNKKRVAVGKVESNVPDIVILVFLGGITIGEMATLKFLQSKLRQKEICKRFIIVSDGIVNGNRFIQYG